MVWDKEQKNSLGRHTCRGHRRGGSLVIEAVIAAALLATASYGLTKLAKSAAELSLQSDQRLAATLAAENTLERLRAVPTGQLMEQAGNVAKIVADSTGCEVALTANPFEAKGGNGIHLRVDVSPSKNLRVTLHDWRLRMPESGQQSDEEQESSDEPKPSDVSSDALRGEVNDA